MTRPSTWHRRRQRELLGLHPELRALRGHNPWTLAWIIGVVAAQLALGGLATELPFWALAIGAYVVGAPLAHAAGVLIHETAHDLVLRGRKANELASLVANIPLVLPGAIDFRDKHLYHHGYLGEGESRDFQTPTGTAVRWVGQSRLRKLVWLAVGSVVFPKRPIEGLDDAARHRRLLVNLATQVVSMGVYAAVFGWRGIAYLALSAIFAFGPHPLAMRGYGEHVPLRKDQPTASYYGWGNWISFFVGYHVEHHDLPDVPWNRLPDVHRIAHASYDGLAHHTSWTRMLARFVATDRLGVASYVEAGRGADHFPSSASSASSSAS
jgi:sphingolipid delta-4 desaturase